MATERAYTVTRKHYIAAAEVIRTAIASDGTPIDRGYQMTVARLLADIFTDDNPRFDRDRFFTACGIEVGQ